MENPVLNEKNEVYYLKVLIDKLIKYWPVFAVSVFLSLLVAFLVNKYSKPVYQASTTILFNDESTNRGVDATQEFMQSFSLFSTTSNFQNQILLMQSSGLIYSAVKNIGLDVSYFKKKGLSVSEIYYGSPFTVKFNPIDIQPANVNFKIIPLGGHDYRIVVDVDDEIILYDYGVNSDAGIISKLELDEIHKFGDTIKGEHFKFMINADVEKINQYPKKTTYLFKFNHLKSLVHYYKSVLKVEPVSEEVSAALIKIKMNNPQKAVDFLNALTNAYLQSNLDKKNFTAENTLNYIDSQLNNIEDSLSYTEQNLQDFRTNYQVLDINTKAERIFEMSREFENKKSELETKAKYYDFIQAYLKENKDIFEILVPSSMGVNDPVLGNIIQELINLNTERNNLLKSNQDKSPYFTTLTNRIDILKNTLAENLNYIINTNKIELDAIEERNRKLTGEINQLPRTERKLFGIERKFKLNDNIYTFLLEKRAEAQIAKASNLPDNEIVEPARLTKEGPVSPNKIANYMLAFAIGLLLPYIFFSLRESMDETLPDERVLKTISKLPLLGSIPHNPIRNKELVMHDDPGSIVAEAFRSVRTNLDFYLQGKQNQILLFTSTTGGEGKSFNALNIAHSLAILKWKTILVDCDLRKPKLHEYLKIENKLGISSFLINKAQLKEIVNATQTNILDFISAGPIPPNPSELINSEKMVSLLQGLKENYDFVIIDSPPVGIVSDAILLMKHSNFNIFVVRQRVTPKKHLSLLLSELEEKKIENICLLLNDVYAKHDSYYYKNKYKYMERK